MKALVTGGTGFIGEHVVALLLHRGHSVRIFSRKPELPERLRGRGLEHIQGDFVNPLSIVDAMDGVDVFFHIGEIRSISIAACRKNIALMEQIVSSPAVKRIGRLVFVSSITVAGIPAKVPGTENTIPEIILNDQYTFYKRTCEGLLSRNLSGAEYTVIRPAVAYGPGSLNLRKISSALAKVGTVGLPFVGTGRNLAPFIDVRDLASAVYLAGVRPGAAKQIFNITDDIPHTWREFFEAIGEARGKEFRVIAIPPICLKVPAALLDCFVTSFGIRPDFSKYVSYFSRDVNFTNQKARDVLGWEPLHTDLKIGIREMMAS